MICTLLKFYFCFAFPPSLSLSLSISAWTQAAVSFRFGRPRHHFCVQNRQLNGRPYTTQNARDKSSPFWYQKSKNVLGRGTALSPDLHPREEGDTPSHTPSPRRLDSRAFGARPRRSTSALLVHASILPPVQWQYYLFYALIQRTHILSICCIYTVSRKKGATDFCCCNFYKYWRIFIIFRAKLRKRMPKLLA